VDGEDVRGENRMRVNSETGQKHGEDQKAVIEGQDLMGQTWVVGKHPIVGKRGTARNQLEETQKARMAPTEKGGRAWVTSSMMNVKINHHHKVSMIGVDVVERGQLESNWGDFIWRIGQRIKSGLGPKGTRNLGQAGSRVRKGE